MVGTGGMDQSRLQGGAFGAVIGAGHTLVGVGTGGQASPGLFQVVGQDGADQRRTQQARQGPTQAGNPAPATGLLVHCGSRRARAWEKRGSASAVA